MHGFVVEMRMSRPWDAKAISKFNQTRRDWKDVTIHSEEDVNPKSPS
jgi:hypothetical protein